MYVRLFCPRGLWVCYAGPVDERILACCAKVGDEDATTLVAGTGITDESSPIDIGSEVVEARLCEAATEVVAPTAGRSQA